MKLWVRLTAAMVLVVVLTAAAVGWVTYRNLEEAILPRALDRIESHAQLLAADLGNYVQGPRADIGGFRSAVALNGIIRARLAGGIDPVDGASEAIWRGRMAERYAAELESKPSYAMFRVIGVDSREIVRVDRLGPGGTIRTVPEQELQVVDHEHIREALSTPRDGIYVSPVTLFRDHGRVQTPHVPTIRVAAPLFTPQNEKFGVVVINLDMRPVFERIRVTARTGGAIYIVGDRGDYLVHPDRSREFGFEFGRPATWQAEFPELARRLQNNDESQSYPIRDADGQTGGAAHVSLALAGGPRAAIIETIPYATVMQAIQGVGTTTLRVGLAAVILAAILSVFLARSLTRPLRQMTRSVEELARGGPIVLPTRAGGEIGTLARAFASATTEIQDKTMALQREADERRRAIDILNNTIASIVDPVAVATPDGRIVLTNPAAAKIGITGGMHNLDWGGDFRMFDPDGTPTPTERRPMVRALAGETLHNYEVVVRNTATDTATVLIANGVPIRDSAGTLQGAVVTYRDISDLKESERQLRQSQKMDAVGQLTGGIAHDFNNILTVITGTIEILAEGVEDKPEMAAVAQMIDEAASRGAELTQRLLAFARRQPLQPRKTDVNGLALEAAKLLRPTLGEHVEIESMLEDEAWPAMIDPSQLSSALINLALNARDAMPGGGKLTIETGNVFLDEGYAKSNPDVAPGRYLMVAVSDTGAGIPEKLRERVFEPFFTTKEVGKGSGLGLSMVYGFIKQSGGHIKIYSEEGHGTTVKMYLPRAGEGDGADDEAPVDPKLDKGTETILAVEDDSLVRTYVCAQLRSLGYTAIPVANAAEALAKVEAGERFDLLFTDVIMPGTLNGRQLAEEVKRRRPGIKVLFTSGYTENAIVHHGRLDPGVMLLAKPYRKSDLSRMIRAAIETT